MTLLETLDEALASHLHWKAVLMRCLYEKQWFFDEIKSSFKPDYSKMLQEAKGYYAGFLKKESDYLDKSFQKNNKIDVFRKQMLETLLEIVLNDKIDESKTAALVSGYFGKSTFQNMKHSVIRSDDGGFYALLNKIDD